MTVNCSRERISDLIGSIYDCVLNPEKWAETLESVNREFAFANSVLGVFPLKAGAQVINVSVGFDPEWLSISSDETYRAESLGLWGGAERVQQFPLDEPIVHSQTLGYVDRDANRYFREILEPRGMLDAAMVAIAREPMLIGYAAFNRHQSAGDIGDAEVHGLRLLGPHFRRAVTISNLFDMRTVEAASFASVLEGFAFGVVLVDQNMTIVHANPVAERMLTERDPIRSEKGRLSLPVRVAQAALERAISEAARDEADMGQRGIGIPARHSEGEPCVIHILPLRRGEVRRGAAQRAIAALFVAPAAAPPRMPSDAMALLYDLTPAETRIFELITTGMKPAAIGVALGIAIATVKTHVHHLLEKTGCQRQSDLLRLAMTLSSPV